MPEPDSLESLQLAYDTLKRHAEALEQEWRDGKILEEIQEFETEFLEEQTARELGVAGALAIGLSVLHSAVKALLPSKMAGPVVGGAWVVGGAFIAWRLTAGTVAGWVASVDRNARRKRRLQRKLQLVEDRIRLMVATQEALLRKDMEAAALQPPEPRRVSPTGSAGSSVELVEAPSVEESTSVEQTGASGSGQGTPPEGFDSWRRYASLSRRKKE